MTDATVDRAKRRRWDARTMEGYCLYVTAGAVPAPILQTFRFRWAEAMGLASWVADHFGVGSREIAVMPINVSVRPRSEIAGPAAVAALRLAEMVAALSDATDVTMVAAADVRAVLDERLAMINALEMMGDRDEP